MSADTVTCPRCGHVQPPAMCCSACRTCIKPYGAVKEALSRLENSLVDLQGSSQTGVPGGSGTPPDTARRLAEAYQGLKANMERLAAAQRQMATLAEVAKLINSVLDMDQLLDLIMDKAIEVMGAERGFLMLKDQEAGELAMQVARNMEERLTDKAKWQISSNICSRVAGEGKPILATDAQSEDQFQGMQSVMAHGISSLLCVPLKLKSGEILGIIYLDNRVMAGAFTQESLELLEGFANQASIAIENARLYENVRKETQARLNLQRYLSPDVVNDVMSKKEVLTLGGQRVDCTVLFADICDFTPLSQRLEPEQVVRFLNEYFTAMTEIIFEHEGTLDKFIGDAMMVVFGAPVANPFHAKHAVACAVALQKEATRLREKAARECTPLFQVRVGLHSGPVVAGNIGSPSRIEYTVIGDTVNLAARLEPKAKPGGILISDATYQLVKDIVQAEKLSAIEVKGRTGQVEVYAVQEIIGEVKSAKNLRQSERKDVSLFAVYHEPNVSRAYQGSIKNISSGGLQLSTREPFPAGTELVLSFTTPGGEKLDSVRSKVVRSQPCVDEQGRQYYKLGIAFTNREDEGVKKVVAGWRLST
jgi:adenylate cyclase